MSGARRTPLARARGLGASGSGTAHWWAQRATAAALVPLALWLVASLAARAGSGHAEVAEWIARPWTATALVLLLAAAFHHLKLGMQVVIEDYVGAGLGRHCCLMANSFACIALAAASILAVLKIALGG